MGGKELYEAFMEKLKQNHHRSLREKNSVQNRQIKIEIPLNGGKKPKAIDESMLKVI